MTMKSILLPVPGAAVGAKATWAAADMALILAKHFRAYVQGLLIARAQRPTAIAAPAPVIPSQHPFGPMMAAPSGGSDIRRRRLGEDLHDRARATFQMRCTGAEVPFVESPRPPSLPAAGWRWVDDTPSRAVAEAATAHDIVVMPAPSEVSEAEAMADHVLMTCGRPVLIVPEALEQAGDGMTMPKRIQVAWDGSVPAWHAVSAALPLLQAAQAVEIFSIDTPMKAAATRPELTQYLELHTVDVRVREEVSHSLRAGQAILGEAANGAADLLVMGAYAHARLRERILGGATRHVLTHAAVTPALLAH